MSVTGDVPVLLLDGPHDRMPIAIPCWGVDRWLILETQTERHYYELSGRQRPFTARFVESARKYS